MSASASSTRMDRRQAIQWMLAATASLSVNLRSGFAAGPAGASAATAVKATGYGPDPSMVKIYKPGDVWPLTMTDLQRSTATALCDVILPADEENPSASAVGVPDFLDEWVSSPYPAQAGDRTIILSGLDWMEAESQRRFKSGFAQITEAQRIAICDDIAAAAPKPAFKKAASFFKRYRDLTAGGYYTTPEGMKDIGYRGNIPSATFDGPPPEALKHVGLA